MKELWEILVPTKMPNMGRKGIRLSYHKKWDDKVRNISGGLTILKAAKGQWIKPSTNELVEEKVIPVRIACTRSQVNEIISMTLEHYNQDCVMAYKISEEVIFKNRNE